MFQLWKSKDLQEFMCHCHAFLLLVSKPGKECGEIVSYRELWVAEGEAELMLKHAARTTKTQIEIIIHFLVPTF